MHILHTGLFTLQWYLYGEFYHQIKAFLVADHIPDFLTFMSDHFPYSHDLNV